MMAKMRWRMRISTGTVIFHSNKNDQSSKFVLCHMVQYVCKAVFSAENMNYIAVAPFDAEYDEVFLYRLKEINGEDLILDNILDKQEFNLAIYVYEVVTAENGYKNRDKMISFTFNKKLLQSK